MKKILVGLTAIMLLGAGCTSATPMSATNSSANAPAVNAPAANVAPASTKFVDQPYYKNAYLISGPTMDAQTKLAITGFAITKKALADGTTQYNLKALKSEYKDQVYAIKPEQKLYFIETFSGDDDTVNDQEKGMRDDLAVVVDADGNVVGAPALWTK